MSFARKAKRNKKGKAKAGENADTGVGWGWRWTMGRTRRYPVEEPPPRTYAFLEAESLRARIRMGIS